MEAWVVQGASDRDSLSYRTAYPERNAAVGTREWGFAPRHTADAIRNFVVRRQLIGVRCGA